MPCHIVYRSGKFTCSDIFWYKTSYRLATILALQTDDGQTSDRHNLVFIGLRGYGRSQGKGETLDHGRGWAFLNALVWF